MPKIVFLPGAYDGCYYYRGYLPAIYGGMTPGMMFSDAWDKDKLAERAMEADVVVFQRPNDITRVELGKLLKRKGKKIVFENDDTYLPDVGVPLNMLGSDKQRELAIKLNGYLYEFIGFSDLVIASTEFLADEYRKLHNNVKVLKNCIDPLDSHPRGERDKKFRIGFIGSVTSNKDYEHIQDALRALANRDDVTIVALGFKREQKYTKGFEEDIAFWDSIPNVEWHEFVPVLTYMDKIASLNLDLALIPRNDSYFNRCKSNIKFLEMSLLRIPVMAQGFTTNDSPYQNVYDAKHMQVIVNDEDWLPAVENTIKNYDQYATLSDKAHDYVLKNYNIKKYAPKWREAIETLCN